MIETIYTVLFTLEGKDPSKNKYVDMFFIWLAFLKRFGGSFEETKICLCVDDLTLEYLKSLNKPLDCQILSFATPRSLMDGMKNKYKAAEHFQRTNPGQIYLYLDLDVLVYKPLSFLLNELVLDTIFYVNTEEDTILSENYVGTRIPFTEKEKEPLKGMGGISAGLFAWRHAASNFSDFFKNILDTIQNDYQKYYTIEQPYFNEAILRYIPKENIQIIEPLRIGNNRTFDNIQSVPYILINYAGEPGDEDFHYSKLLQVYSVFFKD